MKFPNGVLVEYDQKVYKVLDGWLYPMLSWRAVCSWGQSIVHAEFIYDYELSESRVGFRPCSIIRSVIDGKSYFIEGTKKRLITTPDFWDLGFNDYEIIVVSQEELDFHKDGQDIV
jgi:hypothetical protein